MNYRRIASNQDKRVSEETNLDIVKNSGACKGHKGDLKGDDILIETKTVITPQASFTILKAWLDKLFNQAFSMGKSLGILVFSFGDKEDFAVMRLRDFWNRELIIQQQREEIESLKQQLGDLSNKEVKEVTTHHVSNSSEPNRHNGETVLPTRGECRTDDLEGLSLHSFSGIEVRSNRRRGGKNS